MTDWDFLDLLPDDSDHETAAQLPRALKHERREANRVFVNGLKKQALTDLIPELPPPSTDVYIVGNGAGAEMRHGLSRSFDFGTFIPHLVSLLGGDCDVYVSTWTMNANHAAALVELLTTGDIQRLTVFTDPYFQRREPSVAAQLISGIQAHRDRATYLAFRNHCKIIAIAGPDGCTVTVTGSANLSAQPRTEQYVLTTAPDVFEFYRTEFFESMLTEARSTSHE